MVFRPRPILQKRITTTTTTTTTTYRATIKTTTTTIETLGPSTTMTSTAEPTAPSSSAFWVSYLNRNLLHCHFQPSLITAVLLFVGGSAIFVALKVCKWTKKFKKFRFRYIVNADSSNNRHVRHRHHCPTLPHCPPPPPASTWYHPRKSASFLPAESSGAKAWGRSSTQSHQ